MSPHYNPGDLLLISVGESQDRAAFEGKTVLYADHETLNNIGVLHIHTTKAGTRLTMMQGADPWWPARVYEDGDSLAIEGRVLGIVARSEAAFAEPPEYLTESEAELP
jgi:hypothetical protein